MKKYVPDNEIRAEIRSLMVRQRVDQWRLQVRVSSGIVRITGELVFLRGSDPTPPYLVDNFERALFQNPGVKNATLDVANSSGIVRITGELVFLRGSDPTPPYLVDNFERALFQNPGVKNATLDVSNWSKASGEWKLLTNSATHAVALAA